MGKQAKKVRIFSALEVANISGVVNQTAINWIKNGHLKAFTTPGGQYRIYADDLRDFLESRGMRVPEELSRLTGGSSTRLLVVEDDADLNNMLSEFLRRNMKGVEVIQAFDGFEAGRLIAEKKPSLVLLDMNLPGVNGHDLIRKIKEDPALRSPYIIAISGVSEEIAERNRILDEGADVFYVKPVDNNVILQSATELLQKGRVRSG